MNRIILSGCNGKMGRVISTLAAQRNDCVVVAGIDINTQSNFGYPVFDSVEKCTVEADSIIDFSHPSLTDNLIKFAVLNNLPVVVATTGLNNSQIENIKSVSDKIPVFFTFNMSLGINLLIELTKKATSVLGNSFDIEIIEKHRPSANEDEKNYRYCNYVIEEIKRIARLQEDRAYSLADTKKILSTIALTD